MVKDRSTVDMIKERLTIDEVISSYIKLDKAGKNFKGRCPFHNEKTASFFVSPDRGSFYCFGCNAKGDIFSFVEQFEGLDFMGALKLLAERAGIPIVFENSEKKTERERLYSVMEAAAIFYQTQLAGEAKEYLKKRGVTEETISQFRLGWAPEGWRNLRDSLAQKGFADADMERAGLVKKPDQSNGQNAGKGCYDRFRGRVMFPIMDSSGRVIAFSGRLLKEKEGEGKYINTADTPLYDKSAVLYGIDKAKSEIRAKNYTIMVEGQMDLIMSHQAGIKNTVAASGTALAEGVISREAVINNLGIVRRLSPNMLIAFDSDSAGRNAALRAARIGLNLGMDVKIADIEGGKDPAELVLADPEQWKNTLRHSKPVIEFVLDGIIKESAATKLDSRKLPAVIREKVLPFIAEIQGNMERAHWVKMIHDKTGLAEDAVRDDLKSVIKKALETMSISGTRPQSQAPQSVASQTTASNIAHVDIIARKFFGLLAFLEKNPERAAPAGKSVVDPKKYREEVAAAVPAEYHRMSAMIEPFRDDLILEADATYGEGHDFKSELDELAINFQEDVLKKRLTLAMNDLAAAEREKDAQKSRTAAEECHDLSKKLAEIAQKKHI